MSIYLSNPNILDVTEWQKVINEITNLSARVDAITNGQGSQSESVTDWNAKKTFSQQFNVGSHKILFGKEQIVVADLDDPTGTLYQGDIVFADSSSQTTSFAANPIITASVQFGSNTLPTSNKNIVVTIFDPSSSGFKFRLVNAGLATPLQYSFYLNLIAIVP